MEKEVKRHHLYTDEADGEQVYIEPGVAYVQIYFVQISNLKYFIFIIVFYFHYRRVFVSNDIVQEELGKGNDDVDHLFWLAVIQQIREDHRAMEEIVIKIVSCHRQNFLVLKL